MRVVPNTAEDLNKLAELYRLSTELQLDFWKTPTTVGQFADIMVPPDSFKFLVNYLDDNELKYTITIEDVQSLTMQREKGEAFPTWAKPNASVLSDPLLSSFFRKR